MASPAHASDVRADQVCSDDETLGFVLEQGPPTGLPWGRVRKVVFGLGLVAAALVGAACLRSSAAGCEASELGRSLDMGSAVQLAEQRRHAADEKASAIVEVLNEKPQDEIKGLVMKAMQKAGEDALAKHRELGDQKSFNQMLAEADNLCTVQRPEPKDGYGTYLSHSTSSEYVYMEQATNVPMEWRIAQTGGATDVYTMEAIVPSPAGSHLAHAMGSVMMSGPKAAVKWQVRPLGGGEENDGLYTVRAVGALEGNAFLSRKKTVGVTTSHAVGENEAWKIACVPGEYETQAQRAAICAFDVIYATQYVARSSLMVQAAARTCPNAKGLMSKICAINALVVVASFSNLALGISNAASTCGATVGVKALCASGVEALIVSLSTIGAGGLVTAAACKPGLKASDLGLPEGATPANLGGPSYMGRRLFLGGGKGNFLGQCVLDFTQVAWSLGSVGLAITAAVRDSCPAKFRQGSGLLESLSKSACSMDIAAVIYAFSRIALFISLAMIHCTDELNLQALCSGGVSALVAAAAALVVTGDAFYIACDKGIKVVNGGGTVPLRIGAAAEAGATRRLAAEALAAGAKNADVDKMAKELGYNISNPLKLPTFDNIDSAMKVLEAFDGKHAANFGVDDDSLKKKFKSVEDMWAYMGFNASAVEAVPPAPAPKDESERFVKLMEGVMSREDRAKVEEAMSPKLFQNWQQLSSKKCP